MKFIIPFLAVGVLLFSSCAEKSVTRPVPNIPVLAHTSVPIEMKPNAFDPSTVSIQTGDSVCFLNRDTEARWPASNIHPTHEIYSEFDSKRPVRSGEDWCFTLDKEGIWKFHDHLYPELIGTVNVE